MRHLVSPINALPSCQMVEDGIDDILWNADLKYEALRRYYEKIEADVLFYFSDIVIQAEAMGAKAKYSRKMMPAVAATARVVSLPDPVKVPRMSVNAGDETIQRVAGALEAGVEPLTIITNGLTRAIRKGSTMYEAKRCFLPAILLMVDAFYKGFQALEHRLDHGNTQKPDIVLGTVKGDIHEIGKNLVRIFLEAHGHGVIDLGVDVDTDAFIKACRKYRPSIIGLSAFTTESKKETERVINALHKGEGAEVSIIIGGAAVNHKVARSVGADGYARDGFGFNFFRGGQELSEEFHIPL